MAEAGIDGSGSGGHPTITDPGGSLGPTEVMAGQLQSRMGRYLLRGELGRGGMGVVFLAWDPLLKRDVALKVLRDGYLADDAVRTRMLREATAVARVRHPGIVEVYDIGEDQGHLFFTMRLVPGRSLAQRLREGRISPRLAAHTALQVAEALQHAHDSGLVHRDVKPGNILLDDTGDAVLTDFGLVKEFDSGEVSLTRDTQVLGTPAYMAPEQISEGARRSTPLSDQYALGVVLYQMLQGCPPYSGATPLEIWRRILKEDPPPLKPPEIGEDLVAVTMKAMARNPEDRYPSAAALAEDLRRFLGGERVLAARPSGLRRSLSSLGRRWRPALTVPVLALLALVIALAGQWAWERHALARAAERREREAEERRGALNTRLAELESAGEHAEVDRLFANYADFDGNAETRALSLAWLDQGARLERRVDLAGASEARATAYALAPDPQVQQEALFGLARGYRASDDWGRLRNALRTLDALAPTLAGSVEALRWRRDLALYNHDLATAVALSADPEERALLSALRQVTRTPYRGRVATLLDLDRDGQPEILLAEEDGGYAVLDPKPGLPLRTRLTLDRPLDISNRPHPIGPGLSAPLLLKSAPAACTLLDLEGARLVSTEVEGCAEARDVLAKDLDGDGVDEVYLSNDRQLARLIRGDGPPRVDGAHLATNATNSEIWQLLAEDLDGDGQDELLVSTSGWGAYDVRALRATPEGLRLLTRLRLGANTNMVSLRTRAGPRLGVLQRQDPFKLQNVGVFGDELPHGAGEGLHLLRWEQGALVSTGFTPLRNISYGPVFPAQAADLDGDGDDDLAYLHKISNLAVVLARNDGSYQPLVLSELKPTLAVNLDEDPADELLAFTADGALLVLGAGEDALDAVELPTPLARAPVPGEVSTTMIPAWKRAEDLVEIGLPEVAIERLLRLAALEPGGGVERVALTRAARLYEDAGMPGEAGQIYVRVAEDPARAAGALEDAFRCFLADRRFDDALAAGRARMTLPEVPAPLAERTLALERELAIPPQILDLRQGLDPRLKIRAPYGVSWSPGAGGLRLRSAGSRETVRLLVEPTQGPLSLALTLRLHQLDFGAIIELGWYRPGARAVPNLLLRLGAGGGGGIVERTLIGAGQWAPSPVTGLDLARQAHTLTIEVSTDGAGASMQVASQGQTILRRVGSTLHAAAPPPGEPLWISLHGSEWLTPLDLTLEQIVVQGARVLEDASDPLEPTLRRLALGDPEGALTLLDPLPGDPLPGDPERPAWLARAVALDGVGQEEAAVQALRVALGDDGGGREEAARLLLLEPERLGRSLPRALGRSYHAVVAEQLLSWLIMHREDPAVVQFLTRQLEGLEEAPVDAARSPQEALGAHLLLVARGHAWILQGRAGLAERDLLRALELGAPLPEQPSLSEDDRILARGQLALAWQGLARLRYEAGDPSGALEALQRALEVHGSPQTFADSLTVWPPLAGLRTHPGWAIVEQARSRPEI